MKAYITEELAAFALDAYRSGAPLTRRERIELCVLDTLAAAVGGHMTHNAASMSEAMGALFGDGAASVWFTGRSRSLLAAVVANCAAASALDIDDGHRGASGHAGAAIVPSVLTYAAVHRRWTGEQLLCAIAIGYDIALRVASARQPDPAMSYASGRWCAYGIAAAVGVLDGVDTRALSQALAIAGAESPQSLPQGASADMGTVKGSSPWSALVALAAVERARRGGTGPLDILDRHSAFQAERLLDRCGEVWLIDQTYLKPYASCRYTHPAIDAVVALRGQGIDLLAPDLQLTVEIFPEAAKIPNQRRPTTLEGAQFSIPFSVALAAVGGSEALRPLDPATLTDPRVLALSDRIELIFAERFAGWFPARTPARVTARRGNEVFARTVCDPLGDIANPIDRAGVIAKLHDLARNTLGRDRADRIVSGVDVLCTAGATALFAALDCG